MLTVDIKKLPEPGFTIWRQKVRKKKALCVAWPDMVIIRPKLRWTFGEYARELLDSEDSIRLVYNNILAKILIHEGIQVPDITPLTSAKRPRGERGFRMSKWKNPRQGCDGRIFENEHGRFEMPGSSMFRLYDAFERPMNQLELHAIMLSDQLVMVYFDKKNREPRAMCSLLRLESE